MQSLAKDNLPLVRVLYVAYRQGEKEHEKEGFCVFLQRKDNLPLAAILEFTYRQVENQRKK